ncbi:hypothetical protein WKI65_43505 [Streptomyces sp. MS1.AVA.3]|uniref:hypothetical protein n=1 Tax=Streptomyces decoyicus TaxID=249567 RepID=UPI0030C36851
MAQLYDAALEDCQQCRQDLLALLAEDPATAGSLVHWACLVTGETYGELPEVLLEGTERADAPFHPSASFRMVAHAYDTTWFTVAGATEAVRDACAECTPEQRLEAAETALEIVIGLADFGVDFLFQ